MSDSSPLDLQATLELATNLLRNGGIIAFPTETYYGLAVDPYSESAVKRLYHVKRRQASKPLSLLIENREQLGMLVEEIPPLFIPLMDNYWPGPLTLVFPAKDSVNTIIKGGSGTIAVRISPHPIAQALIEHMGQPLTATSANMSGFEPAKSADEVLDIFGSSIDLIIDGGTSSAGLCSTIVGLRGNVLSVLRKGQIDLDGEPR